MSGRKLDVIEKNLQPFLAILDDLIKENTPHFGHKKRPLNNVV